MSSGRRLAVLLVALALVGAPAVALRAFCAGKSCTQDQAIAAPVPFCPLPADLRSQIIAGYREGRSPDVMAATASTTVTGGSDLAVSGVGWPASPYRVAANRVPIAFFGAGVRPGPIPNGASVDQIAPTLAELMSFERPHPEVRSGKPLSASVVGADPRLIVEIVWSGVGVPSLNEAPWLGRLVSGQRAAWTPDATAGSLPADPAAVLTTIGTGGPPSQHGITGTLIHGAGGAAVRAWGPGAPTSIIATLPDDWDHAVGGRARIGLVAPDMVDRGIIGGTWYLGHDRDDLAIGAGDPVRAVRRLLASGYGADPTTDILAVVLGGSTRSMDETTARVVADVRAAVSSSSFVLTSTGQEPSRAGAISGARVAAELNASLGAPVVGATTAGGVFLDPKAMAEAHVTADDVVRAMDTLKGGDDFPLFADAFPGFAVAFSRYC